MKFQMTSLSFVLALVSAGALAATETAVTPGNTATSTLSTSTPRLTGTLDQLYMSYWGVYHGANMDNSGGAKAADRMGKTSKFNNINFDSEIGAGYRINPNNRIGVVVPFLLVPVDGQGAIMGDAGLKYSNAHTIQSGGFNLDTNLIIQAPTSDMSRERHQTMAFKTTPAVQYHFGKTAWTIGSWNEAKEYVGVQKNTKDNKTFKLVTSPYVAYAATENLALNLLYEMEWHHDVGTPAGYLKTYQRDLQPGMIWKITRRVTFNPYLQIFTTETPALKRSAIGANLSASIL